MNDKEKEKLKKIVVDRTWANWLPEFLIYTFVKVRINPQRASALFQCLDIVYKAYFLGEVAWHHYDEDYHTRIALSFTLNWDQIHPQLQLQVMSMSHPLTMVSFVTVAMQ